MASAPSPLSTSRVSGYDFGTPCPPDGWAGTGECFGWNNHLGSDIGTRAGEAIVAPYSGTATFQTGLPGYGNLLTEQFSNGWKLLFGHVAGGVSGPVRQGQQIGITGANVGSSIGSVTLLEALNPQGEHVNPDPILQSFESGRGGLFGAGLDTVSPAPSPDFTLADFLPLGRLAFALGGQVPGPIGTIYQQGGATPIPKQLADPLGLGAMADSIAGIPTQIGHGLADFFVVAEQDIAEWLKRQTVAFFVAAVVLLVLFA